MLEPKAQRADDIFCDAQAAGDARERRLFVERACAGDAELLARVGAMLATQADGERFFLESTRALAAATDLMAPLGIARAVGGAAAAAEELPGAFIGPYRLVEKLGEGGCGSVYLAEQEEPVRRRVALKIIKLGMDTRGVIARFEAERRALAMMDHPGIARVLDAGMTAGGRPFFVMELVRGTRVTEYCDAERLDTRRRLELFADVCLAIQHAHQKGIIHRDIKPSNILVAQVDGVPVPKVIDFGIAKAMEEKSTDPTLLTLGGGLMGTPAYMSPEQADQGLPDIDTRSDIYSLGVLLYELLAGVTPFEAKALMAAGLEGMRRTLREVEPAPPSVRFERLAAAEREELAGRRKREPARLLAELSGDLDCIAMRALEKERERRYQTAIDLAADIRRFLDDEPIDARPPARVYRLRKLIRRNQAVFVAGSAAALAMALGLGFATRMYFRERAARQEQVRLREIADRALENEAALRREAEAREKITQAAIFLSRQRFADADALAGGLNLPVAQPSLEAADVFRRLALWNVSQGRWEAVAARLLRLVEANQIDKADMTDAATRDLLMVGPALLAVGDAGGYDRFCESTVRRFSGTTNPVAAEQILKVSTLRRADPEFVARLEPLAKVVEVSLPAAHDPNLGDAYQFGWRTAALARFEYRRGDCPRAIVWGEKSLSFRDTTPTRIAVCHAILAMAYHRTGREPEGRDALAKARRLIEPQFARGWERGLPTSAGGLVYWYDWVGALLLLNEAAGELGSSLPAYLHPMSPAR